MRLKVRLKFADPWAQIIPEVAKQCNMTVEDYCRRAVQVLTKQGLEEGERRNAESESGNPAGDAAQARTGHATDSNALPDTQSP
jgi:hypothetical protein